MACLARKRKDYARAEQHLTLGIGRVVKDIGKPNGNVDGICLCYEMASLYDDMGRLAESERFHRMVFEGITQRMKPAAASILSSLDRLQRILEKQGKFEESVQLQEHYKQFWAQLEPWELRPILMAAPG
ncbi:hypothetical protein A1O7_07480 [Cladophialophora yegresii CBS 114405]|uniref:MalT-like TPR region domain-containing protein n=1 Tax=Cladophialophora yegresii CBS 114405 TaxID=1182544 RepID=W9VY25_9EURO|nr:uncharacterized protein A1O7_07480 [Cladophialophora yegresii CBS 114405]EXJ57136.1 hypothetical protein A1O7_07480 [Cladophialophora yegresii CBS 114405]